MVLADGVITALSSFAKMAVPNRMPFAVEQCIREALDTNPLPDTIQLTLDCPVSLPPGGYVWELTVDGEALARAPFRVLGD